jgi:DNA-binding phage protein
MKDLTKTELIQAYLNQCMESDDFSIDDLLDLTVDDLLAVEALKGIGKITISSTLSAYKNKYGDNFLDEIDETILNEAGEKSTLELKMDFTDQVFKPNEVATLKRVVDDYEEKQSSELIELKLALKNAGIDYILLLKDYRTQKEMEIKEWEDSLR